VVTAAQRLRDAGHDCPGVSVGSTPTMSSANDLTGVTEARPGVYMFMDLYQAGLGVCTVDDIAISVLATVIGHRSDGAIVDAGALALSLDRSTSFQEIDRGLGLVCDLDCAPLGGLVVDRVTQEHGVILGGRHLPLGSRVRILPNHACITAAAHDHYRVVDDGTVIDRWDRITGW
jgi:D-serine deaminase-like pyridoxal phosphate-dependent protein